MSRSGPLRSSRQVVSEVQRSGVQWGVGWVISMHLEWLTDWLINKGPVANTIFFLITHTHLYLCLNNLLFLSLFMRGALIIYNTNKCDIDSLIGIRHSISEYFESFLQKLLHLAVSLRCSSEVTVKLLIGMSWVFLEAIWKIKNSESWSLSCGTLILHR